MTSIPIAGRLAIAHRAFAATLTGLLVAAGIGGGALPVQAAEVSVADATLEWGFNNTMQNAWSGAAADGGPNVACHFMSAGVSDGFEATYKAVDGDVAVVKRIDDGTGEPVYGQPTFANRCLRANGTLIDQKVMWSGGTGTIDPFTGKATIAFTGSLSLNFNNFRSPLTITDPVLTVDGSGVGTLTATLSGYRGAQGSTQRTLLDPVENVTVAALVGVQGANDTGFIATPAFAGVTVTVINNFPTQPPTTASFPTQAVKDGKGLVNGVPNWGSWPESFTDFAYRTGLNSFFHSSNAAPTNAADSFKPPLPITVSYGALGAVEPGDGEQVVSVVVPETPEGEFAWQIDGETAVDLGTAVDAGDHWSASGDLTPIVVSDTRSGGPAWSISGQVSDFSGGVSGSYLGWDPEVLADGAGAVAGDPVPSGFPSGNGLTVASPLASAPNAHPTGTATVGAGLDLRLPIATPPGTYTTTLTITALS